MHAAKQVRSTSPVNILHKVRLYILDCKITRVSPREYCPRNIYFGLLLARFRMYANYDIPCRFGAHTFYYFTCESI